MEIHIYSEAAARRNVKSQPEQTEPRIIPNPTDDTVLTMGGRLVHERTRRCPAFCNAVASIAGIGLEMEAR